MDGFVNTNGQVPPEIWLQHAESIKEAMAAPSMSKSLVLAAIARSKTALESNVNIEPTKSKLPHNHNVLVETKYIHERGLEKAAASLEKVYMHVPFRFCLELCILEPCNLTSQVRFDVARQIGHRLVKDMYRCTSCYLSRKKLNAKYCTCELNANHLVTTGGMWRPECDC